MKTKTSELQGAALDWAVMQCNGLVWSLHGHIPFSTDWAQGGPIIERERITWDGMAARIFIQEKGHSICVYGPTHLIAAMRCYVASKLGHEIEVPEQIKG